MILFASNHDYANFAHDMANAYRTVRSDVIDLVLHPHKFGYEEQSPVISKGNMERVMRKADTIHIMHSDPLILQMATRFKKDSCRLIHWATGTRYRQSPEKINRLFNPHVEKTIIALTEFASLGAKNPQYLVGAIDTDTLKPSRWYEGGTPQIYHLPSDPKTKGTPSILDVVRSLSGDFNFEYKVDPCRYDQQLALMQKCDIYLELFAPTQDGKPYGSWGITALEAAALGKVVFTQMADDSHYIDTYGFVPALICYNEIGDWKNGLNLLISDTNLIKEHQLTTRQWVVENHSYQATGKKLQEIFAG